MKALGTALCAAALVGLPVFVLADIFDRPLWIWLAIAAFGAVVVYKAMRHMQAVIDLDKELHPELYEPKPVPSLRESYDKAMLSFLEATGLIRPIERLANWLADRLSRDKTP